MNEHKVQNLIDVERERGLLNQKNYDNYRKNVLDIGRNFRRVISKYRRDGYRLVGYGAAAKGMTFLNFTNIKLDVIIDDNELKQNLYTPGTNVVIKSNSFLKQYKERDKILFIPMAWNFYDEIRNRILKVRDNKNDKFLRYFPSVKVEN